MKSEEIMRYNKIYREKIIIDLNKINCRIIKKRNEVKQDDINK